jgi:bifunctional DNA-binding transcriptional regulator/antitoxin component of YhaV-PrlF toxin-antitoxin module
MQPTNETTKSWVCNVDEEGVLIFPDELWDLLGWQEGDTIEFIDQEDGSFILSKVDPENNDQDC